MVKRKKGDWKDEVIKEAWEALFKEYFPKDTVYLGFVRYVMRYAGPREALHHAIMRKKNGETPKENIFRKEVYEIVKKFENPFVE